MWVINFVSRGGITVMFNGGPQEYEKTMFSIDQGGEPKALSLLTEKVSFIAHRDLFNDKEWIAQMEE
jgi:hypothetical protein